MKIATLLGAALAGLITFTTATAGGVPDLGDGRVTDLTDTLDDDEIDELEATLADLQEDEGVDFFVLITDDSGGNPESFTDDVFSNEGLGGDDALLAVFLDERALQLQLSDELDSEISSDEQDEAIDEATEQFADGDFAAGIVAAGESLGDSLSGDSDGESGGGGGGGISFGSIALILIVGAIVVLGGMWLLGLWQGDRSKKRAAEEKDRQTGELAKRVNTALIDADEALREADQELGFAEAQFSEADVEPFRLALTEAREELNSAFTIRQQLDDATPEDPETRRQMLQQILGHCDRALAGINQQKERLRQLRELEKNAPEVLNKLPAQLDELQARAGVVHETLGRLGTYNPRSWASIKGNGTEAEKRLAFARDQVDVGQKAIETDDRRAAASAASQAQSAAAEADVLLDAIDNMEKSLGEALAELPKEIAAAEQDVAALSSYLATYAGDDRSRFQREASEAEKLLNSARREAETARPDYLEAIRNARQANTTADAVLAGAREAEEKRARL
ncbi:MAG TPA: TPM domain-containing protein, partial [Dehalococcoidia bacterium]|nr:TPM domain-containing protein [Dehalococcoidia bacterium]